MLNMYAKQLNPIHAPCSTAAYIITITDANDNFQFNFNEKLVCNPHARFIAFVLLSICLRTHRVLEADSKKCF